MCKLDTIINTTVRDFHPSTVIKRGKSMEQIEYMTNILFDLAKRLQKPLDKTLECIKSLAANFRQSVSYQKRKKQ